MPNDIYFPQLPEHNNAKTTQYFILNHPVTGRAIKIKIEDFFNSTGLVGLPDQTGHAGEYLITDGTTASWNSILSELITYVTYAQLSTLVSTNSLFVGTQYFITDRADAGLIVTASAPDKISLEAKGLFLVPDFQDVGTYTTTPLPKGTNRGVWSLSEQTGAPFADGDIVFWDGNMYQVTDDSLFDTNSPNANSGYTALTKNVTNGYILECDTLIYDFENDTIIERNDKRGNKISGYAQTEFQWGNDLCSGNITTGYNSIIVCVNSKGIIKDNVVINGDINLYNSHLGSLINNRFTSPLGASCSLNLGITVAYCIFDNIVYTVFDSAVSYEFKTSTLTTSDFSAELDMSNPAVFSGGVLTVPLDVLITNKSHIGIFVLNNNTGQTINKITGWGVATSDRRKVIFKCFDSITQSFQHTSIATAIANELCADAVSTNVIEGRTDGSDFIEYERSGIINIRTNIVKLA